MARGPGRPRKNPLPEPVIEQAAEASAEDPLNQPEPIREQMRQARSETRDGTGRRQRKPLGVQEQRLAAEVPDGMVGRWINDSPGRIERARQAGYEFISSEGEITNRDGCRSEIVGTSREGGPLRAYLMATPEEFYRQDQQAKQAEVDKTDQAIRRGVPTQADPRDQGNFYQPEGLTNIRTEVR